MIYSSIRILEIWWSWSKNSHNPNEIIIFYKTLVDFLDEHDFTYKI